MATSLEVPPPPPPALTIPKKSRTLAYEDDGPPPALPVSRTSLLVFVNGKRHELDDADPWMMLIEFLRSIGLTGTKLGCAEGGCGACTVMLSHYDHVASIVRRVAVNACLMPLGAADWCEVTTIEGIGSTRTGLHPVQERMSALHGSQCGFCTPGIVMSLYTLLRNAPDATEEHVREHLDGNLCRCTGYRPILDAARTLCAAEGGCCGARDGDDLSCAGGGCAGGGCAGEDADEASACTRPADPSGRLVEGGDVVTDSESKRAQYPPYAATGAAAREAPFPAALEEVPITPLRLRSAASGCEWWRPGTLPELLALKRAYPEARLVAGNTEVGIESRYKNHPCRLFLVAGAVGALRTLDDTAEGMVLGACAPLSDVEHLCAAAAAARPGCEGEAARAIGSMLRWFASTQIRNVACLGGNLVTASPISDMIPLLIACGATLTIASEARGERSVPLRAFVQGYRRVDLAADELLVAVHVPHSKALEFVRPFKQARRREDDISIVTAGLRVRLAVADGKWTVVDATFAYGGLAPTAVLASKAAAILEGKEWGAAAVDEACRAALDELRVAPSAPGGQPEYRSALVTSALFKFFVGTSVDLERLAPAGSPAPPLIEASERSAARSWVVEPKPATIGMQRYPHASYPGIEAEEAAGTPPIASAAHAGGPEGTLAAQAGGVRVVGQSLPHAAGERHTTGEAEYTDDAPTPAGTLHSWLVRAERAPATLEAIDAAAAEAAPGVVRILFAADVPLNGHNAIGPVAKDEWCFADGVVLHVGQVIGLVVAESAEAARQAAALVRITYGVLAGVTPCYTIDEAIACNSYYETPPFDSHHELENGPDVDTVLSEPGLVVVRGTFRMGGQEHFYLETNCCYAAPTDDGGLELLCSTQAVDKTQKLVSYVTGAPCNKVVVKCRRMGGGFGGKETRSVFASCACALAAHLLRRPVRLSLRRDVDMGTTGGRHPFIATYTAAARPDPSGGPPKLAALDVRLHSNGGAFLDLSIPVLDRALLHVDNSYLWPAFRARGVVCRTHTPPTTAFRGFGGPQGLLTAEHIIEHLASALDVPALELRAANLYAAGDEVPFGQTLSPNEWRVPRAWAQLRKDAQVDARRAAVAEFNQANRWRKRGIALCPTKFGINFTAKFMNQGGALVHVYTDGTVLITHGGTEMGQGLHTKVCQVAARAFGIPLSACHVAETASDKVANSMPTAASASTDLYAMATLDACRQILARLRPVRARMPHAKFGELVLHAWLDRIDLSAHGFFAIDTKRCGFDWTIQPGRKPDGTPDQRVRGHPFNYFTQGVGCVEVEVDVLTGDHEVVRTDLLVDLGSSINPALDIGQIEGAFVQGMGWTTTEELIYGDAEHPWVRPAGRLHTAGPGTYKLPAFNDTPRIFNVQLLGDADNPVAIHSSKAVGEPPFFLGAITFIAIRDAIAAARADHRAPKDGLFTPKDGGASGGAVPRAVPGDVSGGAAPYFPLDSPATTERIRMACADRFAEQAIGEQASAAIFMPKGSF